MNRTADREAAALEELLRTEIRGLRDAIRDLGRAHVDWVTTEQVAVRLAMTIARTSWSR